MFAGVSTFAICEQEPMTEESPLSRGRGSKLQLLGPPALALGRPSRGGVDRNIAGHRIDPRHWRRPSRGGVDRNDTLVQARLSGDVAPLAGAWIETAFHADRRGGQRVAPLAGAWIETAPHPSRGCARPSPLSRGRGSKPRVEIGLDEGNESPLSRGRGSKLDIVSATPESQ